MPPKGTLASGRTKALEKSLRVTREKHRAKQPHAAKEWNKITARQRTFNHGYSEVAQNETEPEIHILMDPLSMRESSRASCLLKLYGSSQSKSLASRAHRLCPYYLQNNSWTEQNIRPIASKHHTKNCNELQISNQN